LSATGANSKLETQNLELGGFLTPRRFALFLLLAFILAFPGIWMGTETFFRSDYGVMAYPAAHYLRESLRAGDLPLWNPLSNCGAPFLAQWGTMCLYPGSLFFVALPMPWALGVFCLLHLWLGGLGARALAERWTGNRLAAAVAGTAFALNGASLACITWPNYCVALGWLPWIVLLTEQAWREGGRKLVLAALAGTMQMLTGVPELVVMTWGLLGVMLLAEAWPAGGIANFQFSIGNLKLPLRFTAIILLIAALSAAQLLPFFDLLAHSQRDASYHDARWPMPPWGWANFLVPLFRYFQTPQGFWVQEGQQFLSSYYLGLAPLALALLAMWKARERRVWLLAGVTLFALVMALGDASYLYTALKNVLPGSLIARFPVKFVLLAAFTVPLLAAFGVAWLTRNAECRMSNAECADGPPGGSRREEAPPPESPIVNRQSPINQSLLTSAATNESATAPLLRIAFALAALTALIIWLGQQHPLQYDRWPETRANALARLAWLAAALGAIAVVAGLGARAARERLLAAGALLVLLAADPLMHQPNQTPRIASRAFNPEESLFGGSNRRNLSHGRMMISPEDEERLLYGRHIPPPVGASEGARTLDEIWTLDFVGKLDATWSHLNLLTHTPKVNGSSNLRLREQDELQRFLYPPAGTKAPEPSGLSELLTRRPLRAGLPVRFLPPAETLQHLASPSFDPREGVFLSHAAEGSVPTNAANTRVFLHDYNAHEILAEVETDAPTLVTVAQSFYHPWRAFVDGQPVKLWRANYAFQALAVPAGKHTVHLVYVDEKFRLGVGISLAGLAVCGSLWWRGGRRAKIGTDVAQAT
jgi:hypothetical protein